MSVHTLGLTIKLSDSDSLTLTSHNRLCCQIYDMLRHEKSLDTSPFQSHTDQWHLMSNAGFSNYTLTWIRDADETDCLIETHISLTQTTESEGRPLGRATSKQSAAPVVFVMKSQVNGE